MNANHLCIAKQADIESVDTKWRHAPAQCRIAMSMIRRMQNRIGGLAAIKNMLSAWNEGRRQELNRLEIINS